MILWLGAAFAGRDVITPDGFCDGGDVGTIPIVDVRVPHAVAGKPHGTPTGRVVTWVVDSPDRFHGVDDLGRRWDFVTTVVARTRYVAYASTTLDVTDCGIGKGVLLASSPSLGRVVRKANDEWYRAGGGRVFYVLLRDVFEADFGPFEWPPPPAQVVATSRSDGLRRWMAGDYGAYEAGLKAGKFAPVTPTIMAEVLDALATLADAKISSSTVDPPSELFLADSILAWEAYQGPEELEAPFEQGRGFIRFPEYVDGTSEAQRKLIAVRELAAMYRDPASVDRPRLLRWLADGARSRREHRPPSEAADLAEAWLRPQIHARLMASVDPARPAASAAALVEDAELWPDGPEAAADRERAATLMKPLVSRIAPGSTDPATAEALDRLGQPRVADLAWSTAAERGGTLKIRVERALGTPTSEVHWYPSYAVTETSETVENPAWTEWARDASAKQAAADDLVAQILRIEQQKKDVAASVPGPWMAERGLVSETSTYELGDRVITVTVTGWTAPHTSGADAFRGDAAARVIGGLQEKEDRLLDRLDGLAAKEEPPRTITQTRVDRRELPPRSEVEWTFPVTATVTATGLPTKTLSEDPLHVTTSDATEARIYAEKQLASSGAAVPSAVWNDLVLANARRVAGSDAVEMEALKRWFWLP